MGHFAWYFKHTMFQWVKLRGDYFVSVFGVFFQNTYLCIAV